MHKDSVHANLSFPLKGENAFLTVRIFTRNTVRQNRISVPGPEPGAVYNEIRERNSRKSFTG